MLLSDLKGRNKFLDLSSPRVLKGVKYQHIHDVIYGRLQTT